MFPRIYMQVEGFNLLFLQTGLGVLMLKLEHFLGGWRSSTITKWRVVLQRISPVVGRKLGAILNKKKGGVLSAEFSTPTPLLRMERFVCFCFFVPVQSIPGF